MRQADPHVESADLSCGAAPPPHVGLWAASFVFIDFAKKNWWNSIRLIIRVIVIVIRRITIRVIVIVIIIRAIVKEIVRVIVVVVGVIVRVRLIVRVIVRPAPGVPGAKKVFFSGAHGTSGGAPLKVLLSYFPNAAPRTANIYIYIYMYVYIYIYTFHFN